MPEETTKPFPARAVITLSCCFLVNIYTVTSVFPYLAYYVVEAGAAEDVDAGARRQARAAIRAWPPRRPPTWDRAAARRYAHRDRQAKFPTKKLARIRWSAC